MASAVPYPARVERRVQESPEVFSLWLRRADVRVPFSFQPGQFNMLGLHGVGEVPISIVDCSPDGELLMHTVRDVGRVTHGLAGLGVGDRVGLRGPFGSGWPLVQARGRDLVFVTGGLGCAPVLAAIRHVLARRADYGRVSVLQGVRHSEDLIWRDCYADWQRNADMTVLLAADVVAKPSDDFFRGNVVELFRRLELVPEQTLAMMCGPEVMMAAAVGELRDRGVAATDVWLSLERNMHCGSGLCGHCQLGPRFVCRDGPVFRYADIADWFGVHGF
jgi:sulfhydrogenase subunit gamma (sulfur reductase)